MAKVGRFIRGAVAGAALALLNSGALAAPKLPDTILFGVAYYDEYTPVDRVEEDARMMKEAGISVVRIAESTWGTLERSEGVFDFTHVDRMLAAFHKAGIKVIVGTPTYAIPTWLVRKHPNVLVVAPKGRAEYGPRQNMDITDPDFRRAAERVIIKLIDHVKEHPAVIGYQVDNETKAYLTSGPNVQDAFFASMRKKFPDLEQLNKAFGLDYWSNRINDWADLPSVNGSINASLSNAFADFQRGLVTEYPTWQAGPVRARPAGPVHHTELRPGLERPLVRRPARGEPLGGRQAARRCRRGHLPPEPGQADRRRNRLWRRPDQLPAQRPTTC